MSLDPSNFATVGEYAAPVLAVCGYSGSGKTTLLEAAIPRLVERGLKLALVKHDAHRFEVDRPGKDSDRLFRAGADIALRGPEQQFERRAQPLSLEATLAHLACDHDLILVEGHKDTALPKFWLAHPERPEPPPEVTGIASALPWTSGPGSNESAGRIEAFLDYIDRWLPAAWCARPLRFALLVGGKSTRMGSPKQSIEFGEHTLGEIALESLSAAAESALGSAEPGGVVVLGAGPLPKSPRASVRLADPPGLAGPGAGMIAAHRWAPEAAWIVAACDHPWLRREHIEWLAAQRKPGRWAVVPRQRDGHPCPTLALYEPQALAAMERRARADRVRRADPSAVLDLAQTAIVQPPAELADGWTNVNTPEQLRAEEERLASHGANTQAARGKKS
jgi:molybdopterin-guanine dinucleotide biosynthesis protein A